MSAFPGRRELSVGGPTAPLYHISRMYASHLMAFSTPRFRHRHERDQLLRITVCISNVNTAAYSFSQDYIFIGVDAYGGALGVVYNKM